MLVVNGGKETAHARDAASRRLVDAAVLLRILGEDLGGGATVNGLEGEVRSGPDEDGGVGSGVRRDLLKFRGEEGAVEIEVEVRVVVTERLRGGKRVST